MKFSFSARYCKCGIFGALGLVDQGVCEVSAMTPTWTTEGGQRWSRGDGRDERGPQGFVGASKDSVVINT